MAYRKKLVKNINTTVAANSAMAMIPMISSLQKPSSLLIFSNSVKLASSRPTFFKLLSCRPEMVSIIFFNHLYSIVSFQLRFVLVGIRFHPPNQTQQVLFQTLLQLLLADLLPPRTPFLRCLSDFSIDGARLCPGLLNPNRGSLPEPQLLNSSLLTRDILSLLHEQGQLGSMRLLSVPDPDGLETYRNKYLYSRTKGSNEAPAIPTTSFFKFVVSSMSCSALSPASQLYR